MISTNSTIKWLDTRPGKRVAPGRHPPDVASLLLPSPTLRLRSSLHRFIRPAGPGVFGVGLVCVLGPTDAGPSFSFGGPSLDMSPFPASLLRLAPS